MSLPAARLAAVALAGAVLASGLVACSAPAPPTVQTVDAPTSSTTPSATPEASTSPPAMTTSTTSATTAPGGTPSPTPPSRSTARTAPTPTPKKTPTPAPQPAAPTTPAQTGTFESQVLALVNAERTAAGLRPLAAQPCPDGFAEPWSPRMAAAGSLSHQSLGPILTRCDARTAAENVGMNSSQSPISMVAAFMGSPPHRANILNPAYTGIGIGAYRDARGVWWLTQDFVG